MTTAVQRRRGTTVQHSTFTGLEGEVTIDTTKDTAVIHDGATAGGHPLAREDLANVDITGLGSIAGADTADDDQFLVYDTSTSGLKKISRAELNNAIEQDALASVDINGGTIDGTTIGGSTPAAGTFTTLASTGNTTLGDASGDSVTINAGTVSTPNGLNFDSNTFVIDAANNRVGIGTSSPSDKFQVGLVGDAAGIIASFANNGFTTRLSHGSGPAISRTHCARLRLYQPCPQLATLTVELPFLQQMANFTDKSGGR